MDVFDALADPTRRRLLARLAGGSHSASELAAPEPVSRPAISKHLRVLLDAGVATVAIEGRHRRYRLRESAFDEARTYLDRLAGGPPVPRDALEGLDLEVRRTVRERHAASDPAADREGVA